MGASVLLVLIAIFVARHFYNRRPEAATKLAGSLGGLQKLLANKYYIDEFYGAIVVRPLVNGSLFLWKVFDVVLIDGLINGLASLWRDIADALRHFQGGRLRNYATVFVVGVLVLVAYFTFG